MTILDDHGNLKMNIHTIPAGEFKAHCLKIMNEVNLKHETYVITKRGVPIAKIVPYEFGPQTMPSLFGALADQAMITGEIVDSMDMGWDDSKFDDL